MKVTETFFSVEVRDMQRATRFYVAALEAALLFASPPWTSLRIGGVRVALFLHPGMRAGPVGLHFVVRDLSAARAEVERAGGGVVGPSLEVAPGVVIASVTDTEGNAFTLRQA